MEKQCGKERNQGLRENKIHFLTVNIGDANLLQINMTIDQQKNGQKNKDTLFLWAYESCPHSRARERKENKREEEQ